MTRPRPELPSCRWRWRTSWRRICARRSRSTQRIKWPNDILASGKKIAGILIEARVQEERAYLLIGTGDERRAGRTKRAERDDRARTRRDAFTASTTRPIAFIEHVDARLASRLERDERSPRWRRLASHQQRRSHHVRHRRAHVTGTWSGIDEHGPRAAAHSERRDDSRSARATSF
jgi:biotin-(acetyl-CoA carboxylase) ligase